MWLVSHPLLIYKSGREWELRLHLAENCLKFISGLSKNVFNVLLRCNLGILSRTLPD